MSLLNYVHKLTVLYYIFCLLLQIPLVLFTSAILYIMKAFINLFIHVLSIYLLSAYYVPDTEFLTGSIKDMVPVLLKCLAY